MTAYAPQKLEILYKILILELLSQKVQSSRDHSNCSTMFHTINSKSKYFCSSRNLIWMQNTRSLIPGTWSDKRDSLLSRPHKSSDVLIALNGTEYFLKWRLMPCRARDTALLVPACLPWAINKLFVSPSWSLCDLDHSQWVCSCSKDSSRMRSFGVSTFLFPGE